MASCRLSSEIEGVKNRLSPVQQKSKIPVRRGTRLGNNSGTSPSSKDEVKMKQRIPRNRVQESQNKLPSRIPIAIGRASSKDVGRDKIPKSVKATTGKRPLGRDTGITLRETRGKQTASISNASDKRPTALTEHNSPEDAAEPARSVTQKTPMTQVKPSETEQFSTSCEEDHVSKVEQLEKEHSEIEEELQQWVEDGEQENKTLEEIIEKTNEENVKLWVQISIMKKEVKALQNENSTLQTKLETKIVDAKNMLESSNGISSSCNEEHKKELELLEKEHSKIEEELQQWVEDGDQRNKALEEIIETTSEENVKLLVQISDMKNELKALEKENNTLQTELKTKRTDVKSLRANEHYHERELRNLKRDLKKKERSLDNALAEKQELLDDVEYLEGSLRDSEVATELLNGKIIELKDMVKELNKRPDYGHYREEAELLKGSLELSRDKEELLSFQVDALKSEASQFESCELEFKMLRGQTASLVQENARVISDNVKMMKELGEKAGVIDELEDQLAKLKNKKARVISDKIKEMKELNDEKTRVIEEYENQLAKLMRENSSLATELSKISYNDKKLTELQEQVENLTEQKNLTLSEFDMAYHNFSHNDVVIERLMNDLEREIFEKDVLSTALEFSLDNCAIKEKAHVREIRNLEYQLQEMKFLLNIMDSCSDADSSKNQVCVCREKFFAM